MFRLRHSLQSCSQMARSVCTKKECGPLLIVKREPPWYQQRRGASIRLREPIPRNDKEVYHLELIKWLLFMIPATSLGLGCWQVQRRKWKIDLINSMKERSQSPAVELPENLDDLETMEYRPVKVRGHFLHDREILVGPRAYIDQEEKHTSGSFFRDASKSHGWMVFTPFKLSDRPETILVNRGWVPSKMKAASTRPQGQIPDEVELIGLVRLNEKRQPLMPKNHPEKGHWFYKDLDEMSQLAGSVPVLLDAKGTRDMPAGWPLPNQTRVTLRNEHGSYIITWFGLCGFTSWMWFRLFVQKLPLL